jgi:ABC-type dipeptide/oligopeptide/nickel transport system permease component
VGKFLIKRIISMIFVILAMTFLVFLATNYLPSDPARAAAGRGATEAQVEAKRVELGLDKPMLVQYFIYLKGLVTLDMGTSLHNKLPVAKEIGSRLMATLELTLFSVILFVVLSLLLGSWAAVHQKTPLDSSIRILSIFNMSIPPYWLALILQLILYYKLKIFPVGYRLPLGMAPPQDITGFYILDSLLTQEWATLWASLQCIFLPSICLVLGAAGLTTRLMRTQLLQEMQQDYARTARSKGLSESVVIRRHLSRNAISPVMTMIGMQIGGMIGGTVLIEKIFCWPGLGNYAVSVIKDLDITVIAGIALVMSIIYVIINFIVDVLYVIIDPRVRIS